MKKHAILKAHAYVATNEDSVPVFTSARDEGLASNQEHPLCLEIKKRHL